MFERTVSTQSDWLLHCGPLQCYVALRKRYGDNNCYLLESLHGPSRDMTLALVGVDKVAELRIRRDTLTVQGVGLFGELLDDWVQTCPFILSHKQHFAIRPTRTWDILRAFHNQFALQQATYLGFLSSFAYDAAWHIEKLPRLIEDDRTGADLPDICLALYRGTISFDLSRETALFEQLIADGFDPFPVHELQHEFKNAPAPPLTSSVPKPDRIVDSLTKVQYEAAARSCLDHIAAGDIYQIQLGHEIRITSSADPLDTYLRLRQIGPAPYMFLAPIAGSFAIGASPELYLQKQADHVTMRPLAGTLRRARPSLDAQTAEALRSDEKERAEHLMLVDLCRNDLGRVCVTGTLEVDVLMRVEQFSHVFHILSSVRADLLRGHDIFDLVAATFPAGTMTGAPKIRAMELIESFETTRRSLYAGALGVIGLNGDAVLALCIRTALYRDGRYSIRASAGIVADSRPESEWEETLNKLAAPFSAITAADLRDSFYQTDAPQKY
jgi:anthranilate synthase component 1